MSILSCITAAAIMFVAGVTSGTTGFGSALISVPLLILFVPPKDVVTVVWLVGSTVEIGLLISARRWVDLRRIWPLMVGGVIGIPIGAWLLIVMSASTLKAYIGVVIVLAGLALLLGFRRPLGKEKLACIPVGLASGILGGSTSMAGPPVILFFANQQIEKLVFRANLLAYFTVIGLARLPINLSANLISRNVLELAVLLLPSMVLGTWVGSRLVHKVDEALFRRIALLVVIGGGVVSVISAL